MAISNFNHLVLGWIGLGIIVFLVNFKIIAPYGRHASKKWGPLINGRIAWIVMEIPVFFLVLFFVISNRNSVNIITWALTFAFAAHYFHRTFIFPFRIKEKKKTIPVGIVAMAIIFNIMNGFLIGYYLGNFADYQLSWFSSLPFICGALLFVLGAFINIKADTMLIALRNRDFTGYKIPKGFLFKKVSCPNHLGEIIEWTGYALMSFNLSALSFLIWTAANLIPRSLAHHKWYNDNFDNYPKNRKAILPGIL